MRWLMVWYAAGAGAAMSNTPVGRAGDRLIRALLPRARLRADGRGLGPLFAIGRRPLGARGVDGG
eukprot:3464605-Pyramimonas_sp.AAC.1